MDFGNMEYEVEGSKKKKGKKQWNPRNMRKKDLLWE